MDTSLSELIAEVSLVEETVEQRISARMTAACSMTEVSSTTVPSPMKRSSLPTTMPATKTLAIRALPMAAPPSISNG